MLSRQTLYASFIMCIHSLVAHLCLLHKLAGRHRLDVLWDSKEAFCWTGILQLALSLTTAGREVERRPQASMLIDCFRLSGTWKCNQTTQIVPGSW